MAYKCLLYEVKDRIATLTEGGVTYPVTRAIAPSNPSDWMPLVAGNNAVTWSDPNNVQLDLVTTWRGVKV